MRSNPAEFEWAAPATLEEAVKVLAGDPDAWLPIAGGTDLMVQFAAGTLERRRFLNIWNLGELRRIDGFPGELQVGAGSTYTDLRENDIITREFPLLGRTASWTGGIANQNRGTLGGNVANASPAADSLPALMVYGADLILTSTRGDRRVRYEDFHTGYKRMNLAPDELIRTICLPRRFSGYISYARKIGTRKAQAIAKVCIAAVGRLAKDSTQLMLEDVRIAVGSVAPVPLRLRNAEQLLNRRPLDEARVELACKAAAAEIQPISDLRSTAKYRAQIVNNLVREFLDTLAARERER
ncbi:MAG: FAD binding domain-containing protein [Acidobacteria bacterium]|nr:FAD binding domain-containing protein [Acidobacteriota bacterium]